MDYKFSELTKDTLNKLYTEYGLRAKEIGSKVGLTESAILLKLKSYGIPTIPRDKKRAGIDILYTGKIPRRKDLTDKLLSELYGKGISDSDIGLLFDLTGEGVVYRRKKLGIVTRDLESSRINLNHQRGLKDIKELSNEELKLEIMGCRGLKGVARKYSTTFKTVKCLAESFSLERGSILLNRVELTDIQKKLITGSLLGDGGVYSGGYEGFYFKESHCIEQLDYLKWKIDVLKNLVNKDIYHDIRTTVLNTKTHVVSFYTVSCSDLAFFREKFYKNIGDKMRKIIPEDVISTIDGFTLSVWYFDDGGLSDSGLPYICTGAPYEEYVIPASNILNDLFDLGCVPSQGSGISFLTFKNVSNFFYQIKNYIQPCFYYKIPKSFRFSIPTLKLDLVSLPEKIKSYTPDKWEMLSETEKKEWVGDVVKYYSFIGFPYYHIKSGSEIKNILKLLDVADISKQIQDEKIFQRVSSVGSDLASSYFPHMWAAKIHGKRSVYNNYSDSIRFKRVIKNVFKHRKILTEASIRSELRHGSTVHNFKPLIAKTVYDLYCPTGGSVFDYSSGYGGRLLGAYVSKISKYIGTDPCEQTFFGLRKLNRRLQKYIPNKEVQIFNNCSEDPTWFGQIEPVDLCFSSPPYFDAEKYSDEETQSYKRFPNFDSWINGFLSPMISNCNSILKEDGYFIINIADTRKYELRRYAYNICSKYFSFKKFLLINMPSYFSNDKYEPIFVFQKKKDKDVNPDYSVVLSRMDKIFGRCSKISFISKIRKSNKNSDTSSLTEEGKKTAIDCLKRLVDEGMVPSRDRIKSLPVSQFPYQVWVLEKEFGSWNKYLIASGISPGYEVHTPREHIKDYFKACKQANRVLSFYQYEKLTSKPATRLKRLFNKGKPFYHLRDRLKEIVLQEELWEDFLNGMG